MDHPLIDDDEALMARAAWYYYNDGQTQQEIGERLGIPRIKVSRLLEMGRRTGLLELRINSALQGCLNLERLIEEQFDIAEVRVIPRLDGVRVSERLGQAAAQYLMRHLPENSLLAVGWGEMVGAAIHRLGHLATDRRVDLVSLTGGVQAYADGLRIVGGAQKFYLVPAPLIVESGEIASALRNETSVRSILDMSMQANFALVGIGGLTPEATVIRHGYVHPNEVESMRRRGVVGDVLCRFIDSDGAEVDLPLHRRVVGVPLSDLRRGPKVIAAAAGSEKVQAIRAALRGGFINIFITDEETAPALLH